MIAAYCSCGGSFEDNSRAAGVDAVLAELFAEVHQGPGHEPIDEATYAANRERRAKR